MKCTNFEPVRISGPYCTQCSPVPEKHICYMTIYFTFETHFSWRPIATATRIVFTAVSSHTRDHFCLLSYYQRSIDGALLPPEKPFSTLRLSRTGKTHSRTIYTHLFCTTSSRTGETFFFTARRPLAPAKHFSLHGVLSHQRNVNLLRDALSHRQKWILLLDVRE